MPPPRASEPQLCNKQKHHHLLVWNNGEVRCARERPQQACPIRSSTVNVARTSARRRPAQFLSRRRSTTLLRAAWGRGIFCRVPKRAGPVGASPWSPETSGFRFPPAIFRLTGKPYRNPPPVAWHACEEARTSLTAAPSVPALSQNKPATASAAR